MAKYSKGAAKSAKGAMRKTKQGILTSGEKVTGKKQAIATGLSEAREKGAKVPGKKSAAKKSATAEKSTTTPKKAPVKKAVAVKSPAKKKKTAAPKVPRKKISPKAKTKMQEKTADSSDLTHEPRKKVTEPVINNDVNNEVTPGAESAVLAGSQPEQQWIPEQLNTTSHDPFHGNVKPSRAKTTVKPSGKKPLWDNRK